MVAYDANGNLRVGIFPLETPPSAAGVEVCDKAKAVDVEFTAVEDAEDKAPATEEKAVEKPIKPKTARTKKN